MTKEKNKKKSLRSLTTTCFFILILAGSFLFGKDSLAAPNNYNKNATSTLVAAEWNNLISDFVNTWQSTSMTGPLGIGTTAPNGKLQVNGALYLGTSNNNYMQQNGLVTENYGYSGFSFKTWNAGWGAGTTAMTLDINGNVGIGTTAPNDIFSIGNSGSAPVGSPNTGHNYTSTYLTSDDYALTNYGLVKTLIASATSSISNLWGGVASGHIWNLNTGNTGIGTTTPLFKFEVSGTFKVSTSSSSIILDSGGNVLIGI